MTQASLEQNQALFNTRFRAIRDVLLADGWRLDPQVFVFQKGKVFIYPALGSPQIQRHLKLELPYGRYIVKTNQRCAEVIDDDLTLNLDVVIERIQRAAEVAKDVMH